MKQSSSMSEVVLHHTVDGPADGQPLVLGGSLGTSVAMWQPQLAAFAERFRVIRYDHRGHGDSPVPAGPYRIADLGRDVIALLDRLGIERTHLGGLSLGGMVAMWVAAHAPERVDRLMLLCTSARLGPPSMWTQRAASVRDGGTEAIADAVLARWFTPHFATQNAGVTAWARQQLTSTPAAGYAGCCEAIKDMDLEPALASITAPTFVLAGAEDPATPPAHLHRIATGISNARMVIVPDAAHLANVEQPEAVTRLLLDFLTGGAAEEAPRRPRADQAPR
jgi:3-oxoadipate enol-lactonase